MLRSMTARQFQLWRYFAELEPFGELREDYRTASIVKAQWDIARDTKKHPEPFPLDSFRLRFGDEEPVKRRTQTWQAQKQLAVMMVAAVNKAVEAKAVKDP